MSDDPFALQRRIHKRLLRERPSVSDGMLLTLAAIKAAGQAKAWSRLDGYDWTSAAEAYESWLRTVLEKSPLPESARAILVEAPDAIFNPAETGVFASPVFEPAALNCGHENGLEWPVGDDGSNGIEWRTGVPVLEAALERLGWRDGKTRDQIGDALEPGVFALSHALATLLALNTLPRLGASLGPNTASGLGVTVAFPDGDIDPVGVLGPEGWHSIGKPRTRKPVTPKPEQLDPASVYFDVDLFLEHGGDVNGRFEGGKSALFHRRYGDPSAIVRLLREGADPNAIEPDGMPSFFSVLKGEPEVLRALLEAGANLELARSRLTLPLFAWVLRSAECVRILVEAGEDPHAVDPDGRTVLWHAAQRGCSGGSSVRPLKDVISLLVELGVDINRPDAHGVPPLWESLSSMVEELDRVPGWESGVFARHRMAGVSYFGHYHKTAIMLLESGADPNARLAESPHKYVPTGATPLMVQRYDQPTLFKALLTHGADPLATTDEGLTPLDYAKQVAPSKRSDAEGAAKVVAMLERAVKQASKTPKPKRPKAP